MSPVALSTAKAALRRGGGRRGIGFSKLGEIPCPLSKAGTGLHNLGEIPRPLSTAGP